MKRIQHFAFLLSMLLMGSLHAQDPLIFSTGGTFGAAGNHVKVYTYHPEKDTVFVQDSVPGDFSNDVLYDGEYCYLHVGRDVGHPQGGDAIYQYDPYTFERLDSIKPISGATNLAVHNEHLIVTRGYGASTEFVRVYDRNNISAAPTWNEDSIGVSVNGLTLRGDSAYLGYTRNDTGYIATMDLSGATPSFGNYHPMDTLAGGINQLVQDNDSLYALSERYDASFNLMYAGVTAIDPNTGGYLTDTNSTGANSAVLARNDSVWANIEMPLDVYESSTGNISQDFPVNDLSTGLFQEDGGNFYFLRTDFFSSGDLLITDEGGTRVDSFATDISGEAIGRAGHVMVDAQGDTSVCAANVVGVDLPLNATTSTDTGMWVSSGNGTFSSADSLFTNYQPDSADSANGAVKLSFIPLDTGSFRADSAHVMLTFYESAMVEAASEDTVCGSSNPVQLNGTANSTVQWSSTGSGSFADADQAVTGYDPSTADTSNGSVLLILESTNTGSCASDTDSVQVMLGPIMPDAGPDQVQCGGVDSIQLDGGYGENVTSSEWMSEGDGVFNDPSDTNTYYHPGANDKSNGSVDLILMVSNEGACEMEDTVTISLDADPVADAGNEPSWCVDSSTVQLNGNSSTGSGEWSSMGDGSFGDPTSLSTEYSFGSNDLSNGRVNVSLTTTNNGTCAGDTSSMELILEPQVDAGSDVDTVVSADAIPLNGSVGGTATEWQWETYGQAGSFDDSSDLNTTYYPTQAQKDQGTFNLRLVATNNGDCEVDDVMNVDFTDTRVEEASKEGLNIGLRPVPAKTELIVTLPELSERTVDYEILDITGKLLRSGSLDSGSDQRLRIDDLKEGAYLLRVVTNEGSYHKRWVKQ